tara:strand:+ start:1372 stop:1875 length:504 start_codon:yes stop_codon:yes gene_type:complete
MKEILIIYVLVGLLISCQQQFSIDCNENNYFISKKENHNTDFRNYNREIVTHFSEKDLEVIFNKTDISCKDVLANFFYCNICFNNDTNYVISYNGNRFEINNIANPNIFTNSVINIISSMPEGAKEYDMFLNAQKNNFSKDDQELIQQYFQTQKKDSNIKSIKIQTH